MKTLTGALALFILTGFFLALSVNLFADVSCARVDFATYADRNTRPTEPIGWDVNGTSVQQVVAWNGTKGVGNLGIGNGDISLMDPGGDQQRGKKCKCRAECVREHSRRQRDAG